MTMVQATISLELYRHQLILPLCQLLDDGKPGCFFDLIPRFEELNTDSLFHDDILHSNGVRSVGAPSIDIGYRDIGIASH